MLAPILALSCSPIEIFTGPKLSDKDAFMHKKLIAEVLTNNPIKPGEPFKITLIHQNSDVTVNLIQVNSLVLPHFHKYSDEHVYIMYGYGEVTVGDKTVHVNEEEYVFIPRKAVHSIRNQSQGRPIVAVSIFTPVLDPTDRIAVE